MVSSSAQRLKPHAIDIRVNIDPVHWFLSPAKDTRSSLYLEDAATEFQVQGLELDWTIVTWDADLPSLHYKPLRNLPRTKQTPLLHTRYLLSSHAHRYRHAKTSTWSPAVAYRNRFFGVTRLGHTINAADRTAKSCVAKAKDVWSP